ncbi:MAG TPA: porin [Myxococcota bacterium]
MKRFITTLVVLCAWSLAAAAGAEEQQASFDQRMLDVLLEQGAISQAQYEELSREARAEQQATEAEATPAASAAQGANSGWKEYWKEGFRVESEDGLFEFKFGGRIQLDAAFVEPENDLDDWAIANGVEDLRGFGAEVRRARLFTQGNLYEHGIFASDLAFEGAKVSVKDMWVGLANLPLVGRVRAGHFKEAFGLEELTSSNFTTFMERAASTEAFTPKRNIGIGFDNSALNRRMTWAVGGFAEAPDQSGDRDLSNLSNYNITARVTGAPLYADDGRELIHLGVAYSHKFMNGEIDFGGREVHLAEDFVFTPAIAADGADLLGLEFASVWGPVSVQGEWMSTWVDQAAGPNLNFMGGYGQVSWFVTGEHRPYQTCRCSFGRIKPERRFAPRKGDWGALELAARYSYLDLTDENIRGGIQSGVTVGANWYLYSNLRFMLNWVHSHRNGVGDQDAVQGRLGIDF